MKDMWRNLSLKQKILGVSGLFLSGMVIAIAIAGFVLVKQGDLFESAVQLSVKRIDAANTARTAIMSIDRAIQAVIAEDEKKKIRQASIKAIKGGTELDKAIDSLKKSFNNDNQVLHLEKSLADLRPQQMKIIGKARSNKDVEALAMAQTIEDEFASITNNANALVDMAQNDLINKVAEIKAESTTTLKILGVLFAFGVVLGMVIALLAAKMMSLPLTQIEETMTALAKGDLTKKVQLEGHNGDEIGRTILSLTTTMQQLSKMLEKLTEASNKVSSESNEVSQVAEDLEQVTSKIDTNISLIVNDTKQVAHTADTVVTQAKSASSYAQSTYETTLNTVTQIKKTLENFGGFKEDMQQASEQSQSLADIVGNIQNITLTISGISEQTNLLALNAAIEAARAGDQGRGFAVVADEVRSLAGRTTEAASEISSLVSGISFSINSTVSSLEKAQERVIINAELLQNASNETDTSLVQAKNISSSMHDMLELLESQQQATTRIVESVEQLNAVSEENSCKSIMLHRHSAHLDSAATELAQEVNFFKT